MRKNLLEIKIIIIIINNNNDDDDINNDNIQIMMTKVSLRHKNDQGITPE